MVKFNIVEKPNFYYLKFVCLSLLFFSCQKKDDIDGSSSGQIQINVEAAVSNFSDNLLNGKMASNYSYEPTSEVAVDFGKDYMLVAEVLPVGGNDPLGSKLLTSNRKLAGTRDIDPGDVYRLLVYDSSGKFITKRDYTRGSESNTAALSLFRNTSYTFIAYSLNETSLTDLDPLLYVAETQGPSDAVMESTSTLSNTSIWGQGNADLLFYKKTLTTSNGATDYLKITLEHQYNLLSMTLDVSDSGYSIADLAARLVTKTNSLRLYFGGNVQYYNKSSSVGLGNFTYYASNDGVSKSKATSDSIIINSSSGENLLEITSLKIGDITQAGTITPFSTNGVTLTRGFQYNLSVKMIPKDSLYDINGVPVARINGQVWMRYNLGATGSNPDNPGEGIQGGYYQWGAEVQYAGGKAQDTDKPYFSDFSNVAFTSDADFAVWDGNSTSKSAKGDKDPCPTGFRLPDVDDFNQLIANTSYKYLGEPTVSDTYYDYAIQLTSKRKSSVKLTIPAQGYGGIAGNENTTNTYGFGAFYSRGREVYLKTRDYNKTGTVTATNNSNVSVILFEYKLFKGLQGAAPGIYVGPGGGKTSAFANGHPVRCIALASNSKILLNDREVNSSNGGSVGF